MIDWSVSPRCLTRHGADPPGNFSSTSLLKRSLVLASSKGKCYSKFSCLSCCSSCFPASTAVFQPLPQPLPNNGNSHHPPKTTTLVFHISSYFLLWTYRFLFFPCLLSKRSLTAFFYSVEIKRTSVPNSLSMIANNKLAGSHSFQCHRSVHCPSGIQNRDVLWNLFLIYPHLTNSAQLFLIPNILLAMTLCLESYFIFE